MFLLKKKGVLLWQSSLCVSRDVSPVAVPTDFNFLFALREQGCFQTVLSLACVIAVRSA